MHINKERLVCFTCLPIFWLFFAAFAAALLLPLLLPLLCWCRSAGVLIQFYSSIHHQLLVCQRKQVQVLHYPIQLTMSLQAATQLKLLQGL